LLHGPVPIWGQPNTRSWRGRSRPMAGSPRFVGYSTTALRCPDEENATDDILLTDTNPIQGDTVVLALVWPSLRQTMFEIYPGMLSCQYKPLHPTAGHAMERRGGRVWPCRRFFASAGHAADDVPWITSPNGSKLWPLKRIIFS